MIFVCKNGMNDLLSDVDIQIINFLSQMHLIFRNNLE